MAYSRLKKHIHFHQVQRHSIMLLIAAILFVLGVTTYIKYSYAAQGYDLEEHVEILAELANRKTEKATLSEKLKSTQIQAKPFDPNTITKQELMEMGVREKLASTWTNFTQKGGRIYSKEGLLKIYGMNDYVADALSPYMIINKKPSKKPQSKDKRSTTTEFTRSSTPKTILYDTTLNQVDSAYLVKYKERKKKMRSGVKDDFVININTADSIELQSLRGIGPVLSSRIVRYREELGGYHNINQLLEVYGIKPIILGPIMKQMTFEGDLRKIYINRVSVEELVKHPYFDWNTSNIIINYRTHHGSYRSREELEKTKVLKNWWLDETMPYISFED